MQNEATARIFCRAIIDAGHAPFAPHLLYPRLELSEEPADRVRGMSAGACWLLASDEVWVLGSDPESWSEGMRSEIGMSMELHKVIMFCELRDDELQFVMVSEDLQRRLFDLAGKEIW